MRDISLGTNLFEDVSDIYCFIQELFKLTPISMILVWRGSTTFRSQRCRPWQQYQVILVSQQRALSPVL